MANPTCEQLREALSHDLTKAGSKLCKVVDDSARKTFTAKVDGAILEFSHKQSDAGFWKGVKYYGSGSRSQIRIMRKQAAEAEKV